MGNNRFNPALNKKRVLSHADCTVYSVNGLAVRNVAQPVIRRPFALIAAGAD